MKKNYKIKINTIATTDTEKNEIDIFEPCEFSYTDEKQIIIYNEPIKNGMGKVKTIFSVFKDEKVIIERMGLTIHKLEIEKDTIIKNQYTTIHGIFVLNIKHVNIINSLTSEGGKLFIQYEIMVEDTILSENKVYIHII